MTEVIDISLFLNKDYMIDMSMSTITQIWYFKYIPFWFLTLDDIGGFFTTLIRKGLRVVSLNTNYCSDDSWWLLVGQNAVDPQGQLEWFAGVMHQVSDDDILIDEAISVGR